jgi:hypothetical protein
MSDDEAPEFAVVDLGTKKAGALDVFCKHGKMYFGQEANCIPGACLGVDRDEKYGDEVRKRGYKFQAANVLDPDFDWPSSDFYLAFDFLEHMPSKADSDAILHTMVNFARRGLWVRIPSFEQDKTGEQLLRGLGMRFAWTDWHGHPSHYLVSDVMTVISKLVPEANVRHKKLKLVRDTKDPAVVPIDAPTDTVKYDPSLGPKPFARFETPLIGQHEFIVQIN